MLGAPDPLYVAARGVLLDALSALREHLASIVLVGAQAVYIHAGEADIAVAPFTTDGDLAIDPRTLAPQPLMEVALRKARFKSEPGKVGSWSLTVRVDGIPMVVPLDLLVPESLAPTGRRSARIPPHSADSARKAAGLEGAFVDRDVHTLGALDPGDNRRFDLAVAGPSALLIAKVYKILDRANSRDRLSDKDALDVYRILRIVSTAELVDRFKRLLADELSSAVTRHALVEFRRLFGTPIASGSQMAARAAGPFESSATVAASVAALAQELSAELQFGLR